MDIKVLKQLVTALEYLEKGSFDEVILVIKKVLQVNQNVFEAWFIGAVTYILINQYASSYYYIQQAEQVKPNTSYLSFLKAYLYLQEDQKSQAIVEWTKILNTPESWLATKLLNEAKQGNDLVKLAKNKNISKFIIIPNLEKKLESLEKESKQNKKLLTLPTSLSKNWLTSLLSNLTSKSQWKLIYLSAIAIMSIIPIIWFKGNLLTLPLSSWGTRINNSLISIVKPQAKEMEWANIHINHQVSLIPKRSITDALYHFTDPEQITNDFKEAKNKLWNKQVNTARYLLQRIIHSNADIRTKEKCKNFLRFIPILNHDELKESIPLEQLLKKPKFYMDSQLLLDGRLFSIQNSERGRHLQVLVKENNNTYMINAYIAHQQIQSNWQPYSKFHKESINSVDKIKKVVVFGRFKGLIGQQRKIYLELDKLWL